MRRDPPTTPCAEIVVPHQIDRSTSSGGVINSPWNVLDTSEGSFFILQHLNHFFLTFEISSIENGGCWVKRQGGTVILKSGTPTGFYTFLQVFGPYRVQKVAHETLLSKTFPTKKTRPKILSELRDKACWSQRFGLRNQNVTPLIVDSVCLTATCC